MLYPRTVNTRSQQLNMEPVVREVQNDEVHSEPSLVDQIKTFMVDMMMKQEEKIIGRIQKMLESQENRLRNEVRKEIEKILGERDREVNGTKRKSGDFKAKKHILGSKKPRTGGKTMGTFSQSTNLDDVVCYNCKKKGHYANWCSTIKCYECDQMGHIASYCPMKKETEGSGSEKKDEQRVKIENFN